MYIRQAISIVIILKGCTQQRKRTPPTAGEFCHPRAQRRTLPRTGHRIDPGSGLRRLRNRHLRQRLDGWDGDIVRRYAERDRRVRYVPQPRGHRADRELQPGFRTVPRRLRSLDGRRRLDRTRLRAQMRGSPGGAPGRRGCHDPVALHGRCGTIDFLDVPGPRVDALTPSRRLHLTLRLLQSHQLLFDPIYSLIRREAMERTGLLPVNRWTDRLLAVELCLLGPFCHLDDCLTTRRNAREPRQGAPAALPRVSRGMAATPTAGCSMPVMPNIVRRAPTQGMAETPLLARNLLLLAAGRNQAPDAAVDPALKRQEQRT